MASRAYYQGNDYGDLPTPPPPPPISKHITHQSSPYDDRGYIGYSHRHNRPSDASYQSPSGLEQSSDPYGDEDAIPLRSHRPKHDSQASIAPIIPQYDDPFVRDAKPKRRRAAAGDEKSGWFSGRITWACYILSVIQLAVFIAEIARNGMQDFFRNSLQCAEC